MDMPGIGHNRDPDPLAELRDDLVERNATAADRVFKLCEGVSRLPVVVKDDVAAAIVTDYVARCRAAIGGLAEAHRKEKEPFLRRGQLVDEWFRGLRVDLEGVIKTASNLVRPFMAAKLAADEAAKREAPPSDGPAKEPQVRLRGNFGIVSAKKAWMYDIVDHDNVDLNVLRQWMSIEEINRALTAGVKAGLRECRGVRIYEGAKVRV